MGDHHAEDGRVQSVPEETEDTAQREEDYIEGEDDDGDPVEPGTIVGESVEENGHDACAHGYGKPSAVC